MKKTLALTCIIFILTGCATAKIRTASHNGKAYYVPANCAQFSHNSTEPDILRCEGTGQLLSPLSNEELARYQQQEAEKQEAINQMIASLQEISSSMERNTQSMQNLIKSNSPPPITFQNSFQQNNTRFYRTNGQMRSCTSTASGISLCR